MKVKQIVLAKRPKKIPEEEDFKIGQIYLPEELKDGQLLLQTEYISVEPYLRSLMNEPQKGRTGFELNHPIVSPGIARVVTGKAQGYIQGDWVAGNLPWADYAIVDHQPLQKIDTTTILPSAYLGFLGLPGMTAYFGLLEIGKPKAGETIVISGAAGAVGHVAGQIAKIHGCRVVGLTGSDHKAKILKDELGFDEVINYKSAHLAAALFAACPEGIDIYFDNVGGDTSDIVSQQLNMHGRIVVCGQISTYNSAEKENGLRLFAQILNQSLTVQGYHVTAYISRFPEAVNQLTTWFKAGKLQNRETILEGFEKLPEAFIGLFSGRNEGKMLVKV